MKRIVFLSTLIVVVMVTGVSAQEVPDADKLPKMPEEYRTDNKSLKDPVGMWVYDAAEAEAERELTEVEVVPLEESRRILEERRKQEEGAEKEKKDDPKS
ncbi:MAG: hypothetical protein ABFS19_03655 [Thermodesulfobacteriota bacterium]